jgi:hypothetical protein
MVLQNLIGKRLNMQLKRTRTLRLKKPKNNQAKKINKLKIK